MYIDGRFGRLQEGFSEDPFLTSRLGVAAVQGLQGDFGSGPGTAIPKGKIAALAKHYLAYGKSAGGQNVGMSEISERTLREIYLAPWRAMILESGLRGLMPSHQTIFDVPVHGNAWVGQVLLRQEMQWSLGLSVSDCSDVGALIDWGLASNSTHAAALGLEASVDMDNMCGKNDDGTYTYEHIEEAVKQGLVNEIRVNQSCSRVLAQKFAAGLFEDPMCHETNESLSQILDSPDHRRVALEAAEQGIVLLHSRPGYLPLKGELRDVSLIGESSSCTYDDEGVQIKSSSSYHCQAQINMLGKTQHPVGNVSVVTLAEAISKDKSIQLSGIALGAYTDSATNESIKANAVALAKRSSMAIVVLGDSMRSCGEWGDRSSLSLPQDQPELLRRVLETGTPTILILVHGRPVSFKSDPSNDPSSTFFDYPNLLATFSAWRPGEEGGNAMLNALLGKMVTGEGGPSGRLPQAWPRDVGQIGGPSSPWFKQRNGKWIANKRGPRDSDGLYHYDPYVNEDSTPLFPFGYGLSYSSFTYDNPTTSVGSSTVTVITKVSNIGNVDAVETVLVFVTAPLDNIVRYWKRLVGFEKVSIKSGKSVSVQIDIRIDDLYVYTTSTPGTPSAGKRNLIKGSYRVSVGSNAMDDSHNTTFDLN